MFVGQKILFVDCGKSGLEWLFLKAQHEAKYAQCEDINLCSYFVARVQIQLLRGSVEGSGCLLDVLLDMCSIILVDHLDHLHFKRITSEELLPKSHSLYKPLSLPSTFSSLISRCAIPRECIYSSADATSRTILRMDFSGINPGSCSSALRAVLRRCKCTLCCSSP